MTNIISALEKIRHALGASESAGFNFSKWLTDHFGPWGSMLFHILIPVLMVFGITLCFSTCALTCMPVLTYRWISGVVGEERTSLYVKLPFQPVNEEKTDWAPGNPSCQSDDDLV